MALKYFVISLTILFTTAFGAFGQAPDISYTTPQVYKINTAITPLLPVNKGGAVPATNYGHVSTLAGRGTYGYLDGPGTIAALYSPGFLSADADGNVYVGDAGNNVIRKIQPDGQVTTFAGQIYKGSLDGPKSVATLYNPRGSVFDKSGNLYVADYYNNRIRKITANGTVSTFLSILGSLKTPSALAIDANDNIYITDEGNNLIKKLTPAGVLSLVAGNGLTGAVNGVALSASFNTPTGIAIDKDGNLYIAERVNNLIRKISITGVVSTFAGSGLTGANNGNGVAASFNQPVGLTIDTQGNLFVGDAGNNLIRKITPTGNVTTFAGTGSPSLINASLSTSSFNFPEGVCLDNKGNLFVGDLNNSVVRKIVLTGFTIDKPLPNGLTFDPTTGRISGTPIATSAPTNYIITAYNADGSNSTNVSIAVNEVVTPPPYTPTPNIKYQSPQTYYVSIPITPLPPQNTGGAVPATFYSTVTTLAGNGAAGSSNGTGASANFNNPSALAVDVNNNIYVADADNNVIRKITPAGVVTTYAGGGTYGTNNGTTLTASFEKPSAVAVDLAGNVYVADHDDGLIRKITPAGVVTTYAGSVTQGYADGPAASASFKLITGMVADNAGNLYLVDNGNNAIRKITPAGIVSTLAGATPAGKVDANGALARFNSPASISIDAQGNLLVADFGNNVIRKITPAGNVTTLAGSGEVGNADGQNPVASFNGPYGIAVDPTNNIYVTDKNNYSIRRSSNTGVVVIIAGNNAPGTSNGIFTAATFTAPTAMVYDYAGNLIITDRNTIRKVVVTGYTINRELPAGLVFDHQTGIITGTPTATSDATDYVITAYNAGGSYTTTVNIKVDPINFIFGSIPAKSTCDVDFNPGAITNFGNITYTSDQPSVAAIVNGKIHIVGVGSSIITANNGYSTIQQVLFVNPPQPPVIVLSTVTTNTCQGDLITYTATATNGGTAPVYQWQLNGIASGTNSTSYSSTTLQNGDVLSCIVTNNQGCLPAVSAPVSATVSVKAMASISVSIQASVNTAVCPGTAITFTATPANVTDLPVYLWQVNGQANGNNSATFTASNFNDGDRVTCTITSASQCVINASASSAPITVNILAESACVIKIPNAFTPNGDGFNDTWNLNLPAAYKNAIINVYNRYGAMVYQSKGYTKPWDGSMNGKTLPIATYYYIIDTADDPKKKISGSVTIIR